MAWNSVSPTRTHPSKREYSPVFPAAALPDQLVTEKNTDALPTLPSAAWTALTTSS